MRAPLIPAPGAVHQELQAQGLDYVRGPAYPSLAYRLVQVAMFDAQLVQTRAKRRLFVLTKVIVVVHGRIF